MATPIPWYARMPLVGNFGFPLTQKELFAQVRRPRWFWTQIGYLLVLAVTMAITILSLADRDFVDRVPQVVPAIFMTFQCGLILLIFPLLGAISITSEKSQKAFDLLLISDLTPTELVLGKVSALAGISLYFLLTTMPLLGTTILFGGISLAAILFDYLLLFLLSLLVSALGVFCSSFSRSTVQALLVTYLLTIPWGLSLVVGSSVLRFTQSWSPLDVLLSLPPGLRPVLVLWFVSIYLLLLLGFICGAVFMLSPKEGLRGLIPRFYLIAVVPIAYYFFAQFGSEMLGIARVQGIGVMTGSAWVFEGFLYTTCTLFSILNLIPLLISSTALETPLSVVLGGIRGRWWVKGLYPLLGGGIRGLLTGVLLWGTLLLLFLAVVLPVLPWSQEIHLRTLGAFFQLTFAWGLASLALSWVFAILGVRGLLNVLLVEGIWGLLAIWYLVQAFSSEELSDGNMYWLLVAVVGERFSTLSETEVLLFLGARDIYLGAAVVLVLIGVGLCRMRKLPIFRLERPDWPAEIFERPETESQAVSEESGVADGSVDPEVLTVEEERQ
ncbi:MAG TPA: hypothetical protein EYN79_02245 [Planctomycetes bacterium]|nr:hypothetical protein [Planctomycetota bacterium]HIN80594.1 hypothetical protein [Planctomycetota bacterium]